MISVERKLSIKSGDDLSSLNNNVDPENSSTHMSKSCNSENGFKSLPERIPAFGLLMAFISTIFFSFQSVIVKLITGLHSVEILVFRSLVLLIPYFTIAIVKKHRIFGQRDQRLYLVITTISGNISLTTIYIAYRLMPIGDASAILSASPIFVAIFAIFLLKEKLKIIQAVCGVIALIGVGIIIKPEFIFGSESEEVHKHRLEGTILAIIASVSLALAQIGLRKVRSTSVAVISIWHGLSTMISGIVILIIINEMVWPKGWQTWALLLANGILSVVNLNFITLAYKYENAGPVSMVSTFNIVFVFIWEVLILGEIVEWTSIAGGCVVFMCIVVISVFKWKNENPLHFQNLLNKIFCKKAEMKYNSDKQISVDPSGQKLLTPAN